MFSLPAHAQQYWKKSALLADMFPSSKEVAPLTLELDAAAQARFREALGYAPPLDTYVFYVARTDETVDGYVLFDDQVGQHEPITFAVQLTPDARVVRQEVVVYREKYGSEVRHERFRKQFEGRGPGDGMKAGTDIQIVSGATYSSKAMAAGVARAIVLTQLLVEAQVAQSVP